MTKAPEVVDLEGGQKVAKFSIATNRRWKNKNDEWEEEVQFHNFVAWGNLAEFAEKYLNKGMYIFAEGYLKTSSWEDKETGKTVYKTDIIAQKIDFLEKRGESDNSEQEKPVEKKNTVSQKTPDKVSDHELDEDGLPNIPENSHKSKYSVEDLPF